MGDTIAMLSVPCQIFGETYDLKTALKEGTVFRELNKSFYLAEQIREQEEPTDLRQKLLMEINETSFAVNDIMLYLDTHPDDKKALEFFHDNMQKRKRALEEYEKQYTPLTMDYCKHEEKWKWGEEPVPWEGGCL